MEEDQDLKYFCKLCNKRYPCRKSFGVHMRSHVLAPNLAKLEEKVEKKVSSWNHKSKFEQGEQSGYGLRDNPKKTWRVSNSRSPLPQDNVCLQCGKVFQSMKALCGHMACHSGKDKGLKDDYSWTSEIKNVAMDDSNSDTEAEEPRLRSRSNAKRYNRIIAKSSSFCLVNNSKNVSSSVSEIDDHEQEEVAKCLMMLSMDSWICNGINSIVESSDNNSVILETKSSSVDMKIARKGSAKCLNNLDETPRSKKKTNKNLKRNLLNDEAQSENSDSEYFLREYMKVESEAYDVDGFHRNRNYQRNASNTSLGGWCDESRTDEQKGLSRTKKHGTDSRKDFSKEYRYESYGMASHFDKGESRKRTKDNNVKLGFKSPEGCKPTQKKKKYECLNCKKTFSSYQALGGHRPCTKNTNAYIESTYETGENSRAADTGPNYINNIGKHRETVSNKPAAYSQDRSYNPEKKSKPKKFKGHECPFCHRMFKSGQALGGHKRSHFIVSSENHQASAVQGNIVDLLDLNLPAPVEDVNGEPDFASW